MSEIDMYKIYKEHEAEVDMFDHVIINDNYHVVFIEKLMPIFQNELDEELFHNFLNKLKHRIILNNKKIFLLKENTSKKGLEMLKKHFKVGEPISDWHILTVK